jgi:hypothetical protein
LFLAHWQLELEKSFINKSIFWKPKWIIWRNQIL